MATTPKTEVPANQASAPDLLAQLARGYQWLATREMLACAAIALLTLGFRAALLPWLPIPQPTVHDEFSYLLAADTYAHGRVTNPPHPFWQHFETLHVLVQPTYQSKYQPLQGLVLAFGQKFFGQPWVGVYLSAGLMCAAICWMLQGWISPGLALLGALLCVLRVGVLSYWMNSYFGGAVPAIGGALAVGALVRIWRREQLGHSITWALGVSMIALSRPYDAAVLGIATGAILLWFLRRSRHSFGSLCNRVGLPALIIFAICATAILYNDYRVTGHPLSLPYQVHEQQYSMTPVFSAMPLRPEPEYRHQVLRQYWAGWQVDVWKDARAHKVLALFGKLSTFANFFFPFWAFLIPLCVFPYDLNSAEEETTVLLLLVFLVIVAPVSTALPHYGAVLAGVVYLRFLQSLGRLGNWQPAGKPVGWVLGVLLVCLLIGESCYGLYVVTRDGGQSSTFSAGRDLFTQGVEHRGVRFASDRRSVISALARQPGRQLVMLRYTATHNPQEEWVYNNADIDDSPIVWAREMTPDQDRPFLEYFHDRQAWLLEPDQSPPKLSLYRREESR